MQTELQLVQMHNGVSVSDWLGTAALAARGSARLIEQVRAGETNGQREATLRQAADAAAQALEEITAVMDRLGFAHGYGNA